MQNHPYLDEFDGISDAVSVFKKIDPEKRSKVLNAVAALLDIQVPEAAVENSKNRKENGNPAYVSFTEDRTMTAKEFLLEKEPQTDVEKIACLAFYLTHYKEQPHFNTEDLTELYIEAAPKTFSNISHTIGNATKGGYLVAASKMQKKLSAYGERFVQALPDRDKAKAVMQVIKPKWK